MPVPRLTLGMPGNSGLAPLFAFTTRVKALVETALEGAAFD